MLLLALVLGLFASPLMFFTLQPEVPGTGMGDVVTGPPAYRSATLTMRKTQPVPVIAGNGFKSREVVRFTGVTTRPVQASARGTFVVRLIGADPCGLSIRAIGSKGSRAALNYSQLLCINQ